MTWKNLLQMYNKTEELAFIEENSIDMSTVQEILDSDNLVFGGIKFRFKPLRELAKQKKALERVEHLLEIYREGYDTTK